MFISLFGGNYLFVWCILFIIKCFFMCNIGQNAQEKPDAAFSARQRNIEYIKQLRISNFQNLSLISEGFYFCKMKVAKNRNNLYL